MKYLGAVMMVLTLLFAAETRAQEPAKAPAAAQDDFVPVTGPIDARDTMPAPTLVGVAYAFIWVVLFGYVWSVRSRLATVEREMDAISRRVAAGRK